MRTRYFFLSVIVIAGLLLIGAGVFYKAYENHKREQASKIKVEAETVKITLIEGWTVQEMITALEKQKLVTKTKFSDSLKNFDLAGYSIIQSSKPKNSTYEGFLFPDTYFFTKESTDQEIITKILTNFEERVASAGVKANQDSYVIPGYENLKLTGRGLSLYQILTLASIVEQESGGKGISQAELNDQRATIAGIFYNRLLKGQALESDATINYITGKDDPSPLYSDLEVKSAYNTYKNPGLPPGPICNPSLASIKAVLNPKKTDYYYFLHIQPSGRVLYSKTFDEHVRKKQQNR